jgi:hypothetical protein
MQLKPDDLPDLQEGEVRRVTVALSGALGANTVSTDSGMFLLTASQVGTHYVLCQATLSSGETIKGYVRAKVKAAPCSSSADYE